MAFEKMIGADPEIEVKADGRIRWNVAAHAMMGNPDAIELHYDAEAGQIGFLEAYWFTKLRVILTEDMLYCVDAKEHFAGAGLEFAEDWTAEPQVADPENPTDPAGLVLIDIP